jgi:hypothetical protein
VILLWLACTVTPQDQFVSEVVPMLDRSCGTTACHGLAPGEEPPLPGFFYTVDGEGRAQDTDQVYAAALVAIDTVDPQHSSLYRKPLATVWGGQPHFGGENFVDPDRADARALLDWIEREPTGGEDPLPLDELEQQFADEVQPALVGMSCLNASCHGVGAAVPFRLDPAVEGTTATRENYEAARSMLAVDGDPSQSRLLRKALPLHDGGIVHKGGNDAFLVGLDDPRAGAIMDWACAEREARTGELCEDRSDWPLLMVQGPMPHEDPFDLDGWNPGTDITLDGVVLTADLHDGPADLRAPAVDPSGRWLLFTMRPSEETGHAVWLMDLDSGDAQAVTEPAGWHDRDPTWGPNGAIWFVSTRDGGTADDGRVDAELYCLRSTGLQRRSWTPHVERKPVLWRLGEEAGGELGFSALREALPSQARAHPFRFPPGLKTEYHQHFGITPEETLFWDTRELPDGRYVTVVGDLDGGFSHLAIVDRNFGPAIPASAPWQESGLPFYAEPIVALDSGWCRDPSALPDGRVLATCLEDGEPVIVALTLAEDPWSAGPYIAERTVLGPGWDPEPVVIHPSTRELDRSWDKDADTALFVHNGVAVIDALLGNLPPSGPKLPEGSFAGVRLLEPLDLPRKAVPAEETLFGNLDASTTGIPSMSPVRVLGELAVAADGSWQAELPARTAVRIQLLDEDGLAIGAHHNRWFDLHPGQTITQGIGSTPAHYSNRCAACHGGADGEPDQVFVAPDVMTTASLTLSRYEQGDPRRPRPAPSLDQPLAVDWTTEVLPVVVQRCSSCHEDFSNAPTQHYDLAYEHLVGAGYAGERAIEGVLGPLLLDGHGELDEDELALLLLWLDLGASYRGTP